jgi:hypothetical protein
MEAESAGAGAGEFIPALQTGAIALHENMMSFIAAGFTREESLRIVMMMLAEAIRKGDGTGGSG